MSCEIYLISPPKIELEAFASNLKGVLATQKISVFQLRLKECTDSDIIDAAKKLLPLCHHYGVPFILNDRADIAKQVNADGVHIGDEDGAYTAARKLLGDKKTIGVSCYDSLDRAMELGEQGANYVSFGAFYPTTTKVAKANPRADILTQWTSISTIPCVAIGGITAQNCKPLVDAGADFIAVISTIWASANAPTAIIELANSIH